MFQNPLMGIGTLKASQLRNSAEYAPAVSGKYLMGLEGLMEVAHNCNYKFPQLFQARDKMPAISLDEPHLGSPYDVWSGGLYAYNMCMAYEYTGQETYLQEARNAIDALFADMTLVIENDAFSAVVADPYDYPVNEVSNSAYGAAAAHWLYELTGEEKYIQRGVDMRNITLRLVNWYESSLRTDAKDQSLNSAGLSHAFATADSPCPWEAVYTYLPLLMELKNEDAQTSDLLLRMLNVFRNNNKYFYGPMWDPAVFESASGYQAHAAGYLPSEDFYKAENGTLNGLNGPSVYMSNNVFYAYLMYEAFASASDADIMVVNLDFNDQPKEMLEGIARNFIVYNPTEETKTFTLSFSHLQSNAYRLTVDAAQALLAQSYQKLQESARDLGIDNTLLGYKQQYVSALAQYAQGDYAGASSSINSFMDQIPTLPTAGSEMDLLQYITPEVVQNTYNAALYGYVTADSGVGSLVTDGSTDTCWVSEEADRDHYVVVDLGKTVTIGAYQLVNAGGDGATKSFQLQSSEDKAAWILRDLVTGNEAETVFRHVAPFAARYIRVLITEPAQDGSTQAQLKEVRVFQADTVEIGNLADRFDWTVTAGSLGTDGSGITLSASQDKAVVSHLYPAYTQDHPVLQIGVSSLSDGALLQVRGAETDTPLLQISQAGVYQCAVAPDTRGDALELLLHGSGASARIDGLCLIANETNLLLNQPIRVNGTNQGEAIVNGATDDTWRGTGSSSYAVDVDLGTASLLDRYVVRYSSQIDSGQLKVYTSGDSISWTLADEQSIGLAPAGEAPEPAILPIDVTTTEDITETINAVVMTFSAGTYIKCTCGNDTSVKKALSYDVDNYPFLEITLSGVQAAGVHLQIDQPEIFEDFLSKNGALTADGVYQFDLSQYAEYFSGLSTFYVKFIVFEAENTVTVSSMRALESMAVSGSGFTDDFADASEWNQTERASISIADGLPAITKNGNESFGYVAKTVTYDVGLYPFLEISIADLHQNAHVHIMENDGASEYFISPADITESGVYMFPLQERSGWRGEKTFLLKIAVIGEDGCSAEVDWIKALPANGTYTGDDFKTFSGWNICENATISSTPTGRASITCTGSTFGYVAKSVTINLDQTPRLKLVIPEVGDDATRFHIMLSDGEKDYFMSRTEMIVPGEYNFNIKECTGWVGEKTVMLKLAVIGGTGSSYTVKELQLLPDPAALEMTTGSFTPVNARYLRFVFDDLDPASILEICDVEAYGTEPLADLPSVRTDASSVLISGGRYWNAALGTSSSLNFTTYNKLQVCVSEVSAGTHWNIALRSNTETAPIMVFAEPKTATGTYTVDLNQLTGWEGIHGFEIYFTLSGGAENRICIESLKCLVSAELPEQVVKPHLPAITGHFPQSNHTVDVAL